MLQVTQAPQGPVLVQQRFSILGIASTTYAGKALVLTVDGVYTTNGPVIRPNGTWQVDFLFQQTGNRRLRIAVGTDSTEIIIPVVDSVSQTRQLRFTQVPTRLPVGQAAVIEGTATNFPDGSALFLRADGQFELARPIVRLGKWQATIGFNQLGKRTLEIISSDGKNRATAEVEVVAAPPRPPRLRFTNPPQQARVEETILLTGTAENYNDGDQLVLRVDQKVELARPLVKAGQWRAQTLFRQTGSRLVEIIGSEQDKAQTIIQVVQGDTGFKVLSRSTWTSTPTPTSLPDLQPKGITIHHTFLGAAPSPNAAIADEVARMRVIWNSHVNGNGWSDIGYHFIIMPSGRVYAARSETKRGSHDVVNDGLGVAFDGIYSSATINSQMYNAAVALCTLLCKRYGITDTVTPIPTPTADFGIRNLPRIMGHRDRVATECPGSEGGRTVRLSELRQAVNAQI
jgi:hypothetical protein